jgi:hypothetical protein
MMYIKGRWGLLQLLGILLLERSKTFSSAVKFPILRDEEYWIVPKDPIYTNLTTSYSGLFLAALDRHIPGRQHVMVQR